MPEKASFNRNTFHEDELSMKASLVEMNASQLMDELFAEFEQDLNEFSPPAPGGFSPSAWDDTDAPLSVDYYPLEAVNTGTGLGSGSTSQAVQSQQPPLPGNTLLLPGIATAAVALLLWIGSQQQPRAIAPLAAPLADSSDSATNRAFAAYMQRSLARINKNIQAQAISAEAPAPQTVTLPALTLPKPANPKPSPKVVTERVYIPYQPPQPQVTQPQRPLTAKRQAAALPSPATATTASANALPTASQTLVGVLELGDRSAALVGADGTTRQVQVGETLGPGGWSLVKVANQQAIIQRQGELRSIYVGQKF